MFFGNESLIQLEDEVFSPALRKRIGHGFKSRNEYVVIIQEAISHNERSNTNSFAIILSFVLLYTRVNCLFSS